MCNSKVERVSTVVGQVLYDVNQLREAKHHLSYFCLSQVQLLQISGRKLDDFILSTISSTQVSVKLLLWFSLKVSELLIIVLKVSTNMFWVRTRADEPFQLNSILTDSYDESGTRSWRRHTFLLAHGRKVTDIWRARETFFINEIFWYLIIRYGPVVAEGIWFLVKR